MSQQASPDLDRRIATAFFDSRDAAETARSDLAAAGFTPDAIALAGGDGATPPVADEPILPEEGGFWHALREFFMPDQDRYTYAEGLRRGGFVLSVTTDAAGYDRALDILDADGAVDITERERTWQEEGWSTWQDGSDPSGATYRPDNSTAGFGASFAGEDGYQAPAPHAAASDAVETASRGDASRVGTDASTPGALNPDMRERIGAGTASMTPPTPTGRQDAVLHDNAASDAIADATLGDPTRAGAEAPRTTSTVGSTNEDRDADLPVRTARRDTEVTRDRVRGFILGESDRA